MSRSSDRQQFRGETYEGRMLSEEWVLFSLQPGVEHKCPIPDGFDVVPE